MPVISSAVNAENGYISIDRSRLTNPRITLCAVDTKAELPIAHRTILSLVARILITIAIEMGIALLFGFRGKKALLLLVIVNTVTQIILNVLLNIINFRSGSWAFIAWYIMLELAIFAIEAALYTAFMKKLTGKEKPVLFYGAYSLVANGISFGAGLIIANILPGIF